MASQVGVLLCWVVQGVWSRKAGMEAVSWAKCREHHHHHHQRQQQRHMQEGGWPRAALASRLRRRAAATTNALPMASRLRGLLF